jgi:hypothetical protein
MIMAGHFAVGPRPSTRLTADAFALYRAGGFTVGATTNWQWMLGETALTVQARADAGRIFLALDGGDEVPVVIAREPGTLGNSYPLFACPGCDRSARYLYLRNRRLACQRCHNLAFASRHRLRWSPALRRIAKLRAQLAAEEAKALEALRAMNAALERDRKHGGRK